ncbi:MAG: PEGA domain-containing protein [Planctomycetota bacterium]
MAVTIRPLAGRLIVGRWLLGALAILALFNGAGCVKRRLTVRSNPPGARVLIDDQEIGVTPVSTSFTYYASRKIQLIKDGFEPLTVLSPFSAPWYEIPPLDLFSENFAGREIRDERAVEFQLVPQQLVPEEVLLGRAEQLRGQARQGYAVPLMAPPPSP